MKYKVDDKVVLKRDERWCQPSLDDIDKLPGRIATIKKVIGGDGSIFDYWLHEMSWGWKENEIEGFAPGTKIIETVETAETVERWDLLDFD